MRNKDAFVYLWFDTKNRMFYLGYHKGTPDDSYTHSSTVMEKFTKTSIPSYMRRRILAMGTEQEMIELEKELLDNRKEKCWDKYYNVTVAFPPPPLYGEDNPKWKGGVSLVSNYKQQHYAKNAERVLEKQREYRQKNPEKIREQRRARYAKNIEKIREQRRELLVKNGDRIREKKREWYAKNSEKAKEMCRIWRAKNAEKKREMDREYYAKNREKVHTRQREYRAKNAEKIREQQGEYRAKKKAEKINGNSVDLSQFMG